MESHTPRFLSAERVVRDPSLARDQSLGDLQRQVPGSRRCARATVRPTDEVGFELASRQVDRDPQRLAPCGRPANVAARGTPRATPTRRSARSARSLRRSSRNASGGNSPVSDVATAAAPRRLRSDRLQSKDRLIHQPELVALQGLAELIGEIQAPDGHDVHRRRVALVPRLAVCLGCSTSRGRRCGACPRRSRFRGRGNADARRERHGDGRARRQRDRLGENRQSTVGHLRGGGGVDVGEVRAARARSRTRRRRSGRRCRPHTRRSASAFRRPQDVVAGRVAVAVVDGLEAVEIEHQYRNEVRSADHRSRRRRGAQEHRAVRKPGECIVERLMGELLGGVMQMLRQLPGLCRGRGLVLQKQQVVDRGVRNSKVGQGEPQRGERRGLGDPRRTDEYRTSATGSRSTWPQGEGLDWSTKEQEQRSGPTDEAVEAGGDLRRGDASNSASIGAYPSSCRRASMNR